MVEATTMIYGEAFSLFLSVSNSLTGHIHCHCYFFIVCVSVGFFRAFLYELHDLNWVFELSN